MPRAPRIDYAGAVHHVTNRAIGRRTAFETREDVRFFLSRVARAVRRNEIRVAAFSVLSTHYHLLTESPNGRLSEAMRRIQNEYVRAFNRRRRRDGPLFRGRFVSRPIDTEQYLFAVIHYIDQNAREARISMNAECYPYGSAFHYARPNGPPWLDRRLVERVLDTSGQDKGLQSEHYQRVFGPPLSDAEEGLVESRLAIQHVGPDPLDDLVGAAPEAVRHWMRNRAALADGTSPGLPIASAETAAACIAALRTRRGQWRITRARKSVDLWDVIEVATLRHACSLTIDAISLHVKASRSTVRHYLRLHREQLSLDEVYASCATSTLTRILDASVPSRLRRAAPIQDRSVPAPRGPTARSARKNDLPGSKVAR